jgi:hypothetical protein
MFQCVAFDLGCNYFPLAICMRLLPYHVVPSFKPFFYIIFLDFAHCTNNQPCLCYHDCQFQYDILIFFKFATTDLSKFLDVCFFFFFPSSFVLLEVDLFQMKHNFVF